MNKPKLRFKADDGSQFPDWEEKKLSEMFQKVIEKNRLDLPPLTIIQGYGTIRRDESERKITYDEKGLKNYKAVQKRDFIVHLRSFEGGLEIANQDGIVSPAYHVYRGNDEVNSSFYYPYFRSFSFIKGKLAICVTGVRDGKNIEIGSFDDLLIPHPCLQEQQKVAEFLSTIDAVLEKQKETVSAWEECKKGVIQKLFTQEVRFKADDGSEFPKWKEKKLGDVCAPLTYGMNAAAVKYDGENKYIRITDIDDESHLYKNDELVSPDSEFDDKYLVGENDILLARTGASVGKSYLYNKKDGKLYYAGFLIKAHVKSENSKFIFYQTLTDRYSRWVKVISMRSGQPGINANEYSEFMMYIPCLAEQQKIVDCLSALDDVIEKQKATRAAWEELKKGLIQQMFM